VGLSWRSVTPSSSAKVFAEHLDRDLRLVGLAAETQEEMQTVRALAPGTVIILGTSLCAALLAGGLWREERYTDSSSRRRHCATFTCT
jgi:hypothetical protein